LPRRAEGARKRGARSLRGGLFRRDLRACAATPACANPITAARCSDTAARFGADRQRAGLPVPRCGYFGNFSGFGKVGERYDADDFRRGVQNVQPLSGCRPRNVRGEFLATRPGIVRHKCLQSGLGFMATSSAMRLAMPTLLSAPAHWQCRYQRTHSRRFSSQSRADGCAVAQCFEQRATRGRRQSSRRFACRPCYGNWRPLQFRTETSAFSSRWTTNCSSNAESNC